ncbi:hypothetical protein [Lactococcus lactis]|uniref:Uncharacterized protein n=1 Tax=Lactococcus lactis TaxID=1358 RepID=A0AAP3Z2M9_9LACT|nr:hypothetical protein [Lactococcus lactis]MDG4969283.1 hypothetical protein [Lactococcus lactis]MDG4977214.1 hypothetical protein [Lactococcus lactis]MDG5103378.1 hypothetical protein [Lactococcus lactis]TNU78277.1 hypothetical protein FIB48_09590 [Lactococcus lactis subsp. lactis]
MIKKWNNQNIPFTVVDSAAEVKKKLINEFEVGTGLIFPTSVRMSLLTLNYKKLDQELSSMNKTIILKGK